MAALVLGLGSILGGLLLIWMPLKQWLGTMEKVRVLEMNPSQANLAAEEALVNEVPLEFRPLFDTLAKTSSSLRNAIKFTHKGRVTVTLESKAVESAFLAQAEVKFRVTDTGVGISPAHLSHIFEPFNQEDISTTRNYGGTGLGLSISKRLVDLMQGTFHVESRQSEGSVFTFALNLQVVAENGAQALMNFESKGAGIVFMDMQMPVMDELEATREIRRIKWLQGRRRTPIVAMPANAMQSDRRACLDAGMDDFIAKSVKKEQIHDAVERWALSLQNS